MSAATLNKQQLKKSLNAKKQKNKPPATKAVLCAPYVTKWPPVESNVQQNILRKLKQCLEPPSNEKELDIGTRTTTKEKLKTKCPNWARLICGVNRVARCLERDELQLVVVDRSSPWQLHQHLAQLSAVRECKAVAIDNLSASLSPLLTVSRLCAIGIKKQRSEVTCDLFVAAVDEIRELCPKLDLPWLECDTYLRALKANRDKPQQASAQAAVDSSDVIGNDRDVTMAEERKPTDYSHLYIYKNQKPIDSLQQSSQFIMLPSSSSDENYSDDECPSECQSVDKTRITVCRLPVDSSTKKTVNSVKRKMKYQSANIGLQQSNAAKKLRKS